MSFVFSSIGDRLAMSIYIADVDTLIVQIKASVLYELENDWINPAVAIEDLLFSFFDYALNRALLEEYNVITRQSHDLKASFNNTYCSHRQSISAYLLGKLGTAAMEQLNGQRVSTMFNGQLLFISTCASI